ncbi:MAG: inverse autotransporter beta domain-containing protein, partial [Alphaproteobacteria bacterium]|nr:inverse autotransporter beta domain-containing protein [Alphaproteobacteria bacterium]
MREKGTTFSYYLRCCFRDGIVRVVVYTSLAQFLLQDDIWATETAAPPCVLSERKWNNEGRLRLMAGRQQSLGQIGLFAPLLQDATSLLFADIRFFRSSKHNSEGNFGLAHRQIVPSLEWIFGGYGFFDNRRSEHHKNFQQGTFGVEALSVHYDVRANIYVPFSKSKKIHSKTTKPIFRGHSEYFNKTKEFALRGLDYEIGRSVPHLDCLRLYVAGYNFQANGVKSINGVRARFRLDVNRYINIDGEYQYDNVRHSAPYIGFTVRIPFGEVTEKPLTPLEKRMQTDIIRDIDIVTGKRKTPEPSGREFFFTKPGGTGSGTFEDPAPPPSEEPEVLAKFLKENPSFWHYDLDDGSIKTAPQVLEELQPILEQNSQKFEEEEARKAESERKRKAEEKAANQEAKRRRRAEEEAAEIERQAAERQRQEEERRRQEETERQAREAEAEAARQRQIEAEAEAARQRQVEAERQAAARRAEEAAEAERQLAARRAEEEQNRQAAERQRQEEERRRQE